jgi:hypothetical protein
MARRPIDITAWNLLEIDRFDCSSDLWHGSLLQFDANVLLPVSRAYPVVRFVSSAQIVRVDGRPQFFISEHTQKRDSHCGILLVRATLVLQEVTPSCLRLVLTWLFPASSMISVSAMR